MARSDAGAEVKHHEFLTSVPAAGRPGAFSVSHHIHSVLGPSHTPAHFIPLTRKQIDTHHHVYLTFIVSNSHTLMAGETLLLYEGVSKSFRTGHLERELQLVQLSATRCSCIAIVWVSEVSFAVITLCIASRRVFTIVVYIVNDSVRKRLVITSYTAV
jgi:hypothetical protein